MKPAPRICPICKETFQPLQKHRLTCSDRCRQRKSRLGKSGPADRVAALDAGLAQLRRQADQLERRIERAELARQMIVDMPASDLGEGA